MIEFKIISSPDRSQQATYQHMGRELSFGKTEGDMLVDDPGFGELQLKVIVDGDKSATIENLHFGVEVRLNGKAISGTVPLKEKDNVTVARTTINFSRLDLASQPIPDPFEHPNARERFTPGSKEQAMLDVLTYLEGRAPAPASAAPPPPPGASPMPPKPPLPHGGGVKPPLPPGSPPMPPPLPTKKP